MHKAYDENQIRAAEQFVQQYGYKWEKEMDPHHMECAAQIHTETDEKVFYYTTVSTFRKFAESGCLWASHIKRMNDWQEFEWGRTKILEALTQFLENADRTIEKATVDYIQNVIAAAKRTMLPYKTTPRFGYGREYTDYWNSEVYNLSFTTNKDLLSQWKMYARESGVAIEFDFSRASDFWQKVVVGGKECMDFKQENRFPRKINYEASQLEDQLNRSIKQINEDADQSVWHMICLLEQIPFFKHPGFSQEGESRLIFRPYKKRSTDGKLTFSKVGYREWGHVLVPYLEIYCGESKSWDDDLSECIGWPVISITVGPGHDQDVVFESLVHRLEYGNTKFRPFSDEEKLQAKKKYFQDFADAYREKFPASEKVVDRWIASYLNCFKFQQWDQDLFSASFKEIDDNQKNQLQHEYVSYCAGHYICDSGIVIKKSQIPYIF